jgi:predicted aspartyl protease
MTASNQFQPLPQPSQQTYNPYQHKITQKQENVKLTSFLKLGYILGILSLFIIGALVLTKKFTSEKKQSQLAEGILLETKYQIVLWRDFGEVFEPIVKIPVFYPGTGYQKEDFLLDSGAVVSSLPREKAAELGFSLAKLPRSTFSGFGNTTSFAYKADLKILLGNQEITIPVVFTEAASTKAILGRSGFFESYNVYFNSKANKIEIRM